MSSSGPLRVSRVAVLGDVHTEAETVVNVLAYVNAMTEDERPEYVLCVGDIVDGEGDADTTVRALREAGVVCVAGNHERWFLNDEMRQLKHVTPTLDEENRSFLASLPITLRMETPRGGALLCHGVGEDDMTFLRSDTKGYDLQIPALKELMMAPEISFMVGGHTHERMTRAFQGLGVINAGTLRRDDDPGFIVIDFESGRVRCFDLSDFGAEIREVEPLDLPEPLPLPGIAFEGEEEDEDDWY